MPNDACVEFADCDCIGPHLALVRDSKDPGGPVLTFDAVSWTVAMNGIKAGAWQPLQLTG